VKRLLLSRFPFGRRGRPPRLNEAIVIYGGGEFVIRALNVAVKVQQGGLAGDFAHLIQAIQWIFAGGDGGLFGDLPLRLRQERPGLFVGVVQGDGALERIDGDVGLVLFESGLSSLDQFFALSARLASMVASTLVVGSTAATGSVAAGVSVAATGSVAAGVSVLATGSVAAGVSVAAVAAATSLFLFTSASCAFASLRSAGGRNSLSAAVVKHPSPWPGRRP